MPPETSGRRKRKVWQCTGIVLQLIIYIANGLVWLASIVAILFGFVVGLGSSTMSMSDFQMLDLLVTTPGTIFIFYGVPMLIITTVGCFASVSAKLCTIAIYCVLIIGLVVFDIVMGISFYIKPSAYEDYLESLKKSQKHYTDTDEDADKLGIIPMHPKVFWDHVQSRASCCGLHSFEEWKAVPLGTEEHHSSIPDSCCNDHYAYFQCGMLFWKHPDHGRHIKNTLINDKGCMSNFPDTLQQGKSGTLEGFGKLALLTLFLSMILAIVLLVLVASKCFRPDKGIANPDFMHVPDEDEDSERGRARRVHPAADGSGDSGHKGQRKISFDYAPQFIPEQTYWSDADANAN